MITKFTCHAVALLRVAFFLAITLQSFGQNSTPVSLSRANELLNSGDAGTLRNHLVSKLQATAGKVSTAEKITLSGHGKTVNCEIVSQLVSYKRENVEQIVVNFTESGVTRSINLVQYANGDVGVLEGDKLVTYSLASREQACLDELFGPGSNCATCKNKVNVCRTSNNNRVIKTLKCLLLNVDGSCLACGVDYYTLAACILLP